MALTDCLSDWIGLRGTCTAETPGSGLYINDLPRINIQFMENLTDGEQGTFLEIWEKVERRGLATFGGKVKQMLRANLQFNTIASSVSLGEWKNDGTTVTPDVGYFVGYKISAVRNKYLSLYLNYVTFWSDSALLAQIRVYDLDTGTLLSTQGLPVPQVGTNVINFNEEFSLSEGRNLFICFPTIGDTGIRVNQGIYPNQGRELFSASFGRISNASALIADNFESAGIDCGIMIPNFNLVCSMDEYICQHRGPLTLALWYWMGYEFMQEWLGNFGNQQINADVLIDDDLKRNWRDWYKASAEAELTEVLGSIKPDYDGVCFECSPAVQVKYHLP